MNRKRSRSHLFQIFFWAPLVVRNCSMPRSLFSPRRRQSHMHRNVATADTRQISSTRHIQRLKASFGHGKIASIGRIKASSSTDHCKRAQTSSTVQISRQGEARHLGGPGAPRRIGVCWHAKLRTGRFWIALRMGIKLAIKSKTSGQWGSSTSEGGSTLG